MSPSISIFGSSVGSCSRSNIRIFILLLFFGLLFFSLITLSSSHLSNQNFLIPPLYNNYYNSQPLAAKSPSSFEYVDARFNVILYDNDTAHFYCFFSANNTGIQNINELNISFSVTDPLNLQVENETDLLYNTVTETLSTKTIIHLNIPELEPSVLYNFTVSFDTSQVISLTKSFTQFFYNLNPEVNMTEVIFEVKLPPERFLYTEIDPLYPAGSINYTDGSSIIFQWNLGLTEDETKLFVVLYQLPGLTTTPQTSYIPLFLTNNSSLNPLLFVLIFLAGLGVGIFGFYLYHRNRLVETVSDTSLTLLNEAEVEIIRVIASSEEKRVTQKEIQKATNYSKAKVSITLSILEKKGFIKKESRGRTNIVTLLRDIRV